MQKCKIRKWKFVEELEKYYDEAITKFWLILNFRNKEEVHILFHVSLSTGAVILAGWRHVGHVNLTEIGKYAKFGGDKAYNDWHNEHFKDRFCKCKQTVSFILNGIYQFFVKNPTNLIPNPIEPERQLGLTIYRLAHWYLFPVVNNLFGISKSLAKKTFNHLEWWVDATAYSAYLKMPENENEWINKIKDFIENYEFPSIGTWYGFHGYISSK